VLKENEEMPNSQNPSLAVTLLLLLKNMYVAMESRNLETLMITA